MATDKNGPLIPFRTRFVPVSYPFRTRFVQGTKRSGSGLISEDCESLLLEGACVHAV